MRTIPTALADHLEEEVTSLTTVWQIIRTDGVVIRLTDNDRPITINGDVYNPATGYDRTAIQTRLGTASDNMSITGFFDDDTITQQDIDNGLYDFAELRIWIVNHQDTSQGVIALLRGNLGEFEHTAEGLFEATFRSMAEAFRNKIGEKTSATCRADLGDGRCTIPIQPNIIQRVKQYALGEFVRVITDANGIDTTSIPWVNPGFNTNLSGWTITDGFLHVGTLGNSGFAAYEGAGYLRGDTNGAFNSINQVFDLTTLATDIDMSLVDTGLATISGSCRAVSDTTVSDDKGRVLVEALDADGVLTAILLDTASVTFYTQRTWKEVSFANKALPPNTRKLRWTFEMTRASGLAADVGFDAVSTEITTYAYGVGSQTSFENRIYQVMTAGITDSAQPTFNTTIDATTTDGTVVFKAVTAWTRDAVVDTVTDRRNFSIIVDEDRAVDGWFEGGVITIESGDNLGRSIEVKRWTSIGSVIKIFLPFAYNLAPGDMLRISPGCDKTQPTCLTKYANVINMRAEYKIPTEENLTTTPFNGIRAPVASSAS